MVRMFYQGMLYAYPVSLLFGSICGWVALLKNNKQHG